MKTNEIWTKVPNVDEWAIVSNLGHLRILDEGPMAEEHIISYSNKAEAFGWSFKRRGKSIFLTRSQLMVPFLNLGATVKIDTTMDEYAFNTATKTYIEVLESNTDLSKI